MAYVPTVDAKVYDGVLYLNVNPYIPNDVKYNIKIKDISAVDMLQANSNSTIDSKKLRSTNPNLELYTLDQAKVNLQGVVNVRKITQRSSATSQIAWLDADDVSISSTSGNLTLAGIAKHARIKSYGIAAVDARHLRGDTIFASSNQDSKLKLNSLQYLYAHASDSSLIEYSDNYSNLVKVSNGVANVIETFK
jgi:hypothetical protein